MRALNVGLLFRLHKSLGELNALQVSGGKGVYLLQRKICGQKFLFETVRPDTVRRADISTDRARARLKVASAVLRSATIPRTSSAEILSPLLGNASATNFNASAISLA